MIDRQRGKKVDTGAQHFEHRALTLLTRLGHIRLRPEIQPELDPIIAQIYTDLKTYQAAPQENEELLENIIHRAETAIDTYQIRNTDRTPVPVEDIIPDAVGDTETMREFKRLQREVIGRLAELRAENVKFDAHQRKLAHAAMPLLQDTLRTPPDEEIIPQMATLQELLTALTDQEEREPPIEFPKVEFDSTVGSIIIRNPAGREILNDKSRGLIGFTLDTAPFQKNKISFALKKPPHEIAVSCIWNEYKRGKFDRGNLIAIINGEAAKDKQLEGTEADLKRFLSLFLLVVGQHEVKKRIATSPIKARRETPPASGTLPEPESLESGMTIPSPEAPPVDPGEPVPETKQEQKEIPFNIPQHWGAVSFEKKQLSDWKKARTPASDRLVDITGNFSASSEGAPLDKEKSIAGGKDRVVYRPDLGMYLVCDGVSSEESEPIVEKTIEIISRKMEDLPLEYNDVDGVHATLDVIFRNTIKEVQIWAQNQNLKGGTTLTLCVFRGNHLFTFNIGDSPAAVYRPHNPKESQIEWQTIDHNMPYELYHNNEEALALIEYHFRNAPDPRNANYLNDIHLPIPDLNVINSYLKLLEREAATSKRKTALLKLQTLVEGVQGGPYLTTPQSRRVLEFLYDTQSLLLFGIGRRKNVLHHSRVTTFGPDDVLYLGSDTLKNLYQEKERIRLENCDTSGESALWLSADIAEELMVEGPRAEIDDASILVVKRRSASTAIKAYIKGARHLLDEIEAKGWSQPDIIANSRALFDTIEANPTASTYYEVCRQAKQAHDKVVAFYEWEENARKSLFYGIENLFENIGERAQAVFQEIDQIFQRKGLEAANQYIAQIFAHDLHVPDTILNLMEALQTKGIIWPEHILAKLAARKAPSVEETTKKEATPKQKPRQPWWKRGIFGLYMKAASVFVPEIKEEPKSSAYDALPPASPSGVLSSNFWRKGWARITNGFMSAIAAISNPYQTPERIPTLEQRPVPVIVRVDDHPEQKPTASTFDLGLPTSELTSERLAQGLRDTVQDITTKAQEGISALDAGLLKPVRDHIENLQIRAETIRGVQHDIATIHRGEGVSQALKRVLEEKRISEQQINSQKQPEARTETWQLTDEEIKDAIFTAVKQFHLPRLTHENKHWEFDFDPTTKQFTRVAEMKENTPIVTLKTPDVYEEQEKPASRTSVTLRHRTFTVGDIVEYQPLVAQPGKYEITRISPDGSKIFIKNTLTPEGSSIPVKAQTFDIRTPEAQNKKYTLDGLWIEELPGDAYNVRFTTLSGKGVIKALATLILQVEFQGNTAVHAMDALKLAQEAVYQNTVGTIPDTYDPTIEYTRVPRATADNRNVVSTDSFVVKKDDDGKWLIESAHFSQGERVKSE